MIPRTQHQAAIRDLLQQFPVVGLIGARQVGKTTLARHLIAEQAAPVTVFDLEEPTDAARLADPALALAPLRGLVVIDEVQRSEGLFSIAARPGRPARQPRPLPRPGQRRPRP